MRRVNAKAALSPQQLYELVSIVTGFAVVAAIVIATIHWESTERQKDSLAAGQAAANLRASGQASAEDPERAKRQRAALSFAGEAEAAASSGSQGGPGVNLGYAPAYATTRPRQVFGEPDGPLVDPRQMPGKPGASVTIRGVSSDQAPGRDRSRKNRIQNGPVSSAEAETIKSAARQRSGVSASQND